MCHNDLGDDTQEVKNNNTAPKVDKIDRLVQEIWLESPGIGNKALREEVQQRLPPSTTVVTKQRIKKAKALLPYQYSDTVIRHPQHDFIVKKLQERTSLRMERRYEEADHIHRGLDAMGISIDDTNKKWTVGDTVTSIKSDFSPNSSTDGVPCDTCGRYFASRNLVFKHLRDPASGCGTILFASGLQLGEAPSTSMKRKKQQQQTNTAPRAPGKAAQHAPASHSVWLGDLPLAWTRPTARYKRLRALLFAHLPRSVQEPWIKKVTRKAYRSRTSNEYRGYAIIIFRNVDEARVARETLDGKQVNANNTFQQVSNKLQNVEEFILKAQPVENDDSASAETAWQCSGNKGGRDPPLEEQLRPLDLSELLRRIERLQGISEPHGRSTASTDEALYHQQHQEALEKLVALSTPDRDEVHLQGRPVPEHLCNRLLELLQSLQWPARNERPRLTSERYLVLPSNVTNDRFYSELREACHELMDWADPDYSYSGIAVTKNFVASPHIDVKDQTYQYAMSLGDFEGGGQLCVEGWNDKNGDDFVNVVDTNKRLAQVDGRQVHWVRTWDEGDRYSLIFYDTSGQKSE